MIIPEANQVEKEQAPLNLFMTSTGSPTVLPAHLADACLRGNKTKGRGTQGRLKCQGTVEPRMAPWRFRMEASNCHCRRGPEVPCAGPAKFGARLPFPTSPSRNQ